MSTGTGASEEIAICIIRMEEAERETSGFLKNTGIYLPKLHFLTSQKNTLLKIPILILLVQEQTHAKLQPTPTILDLPKQLAAIHLENSPLSAYQKVRHHQEKSSPVGSILRTIVHDFTTNFFQIQFNTILQSIPSSANLLSTLKFIHNKLGNAHRENTFGPSLVTVPKLVNPWII